MYKQKVFKKGIEGRRTLFLLLKDFGYHSYLHSLFFEPTNYVLQTITFVLYSNSSKCTQYASCVMNTETNKWIPLGCCS